MPAPIAFDDVAQALAARGSTVHAAEAHGCLCGALCARRVYLPAEWLEELLPDEPTAEDPAALTEIGPLA
ncbi:MAG: YecA family protein, partial [Gammaproteobacteria bacterium]|nr:YecA family protein [Gammaproteobacteria bacterium]